jgi:hypothetical protein
MNYYAFIKKIKIFILLLLSLQSIAQPGFTENKFPVKGELVNVKNWGSRALMILSDNYFSATRDSIIYQVGDQEFEEISKHCAANGWPDGLYSPGSSGQDEKSFDEKLNKLKIYRIATYTHIYNGKTFDRYIILRVPFEENKGWDATVRWTGKVYFLLKESDIEIRK